MPHESFVAPEIKTYTLEDFRAKMNELKHGGKARNLQTANTEELTLEDLESWLTLDSASRQNMTYDAAPKPVKELIKRLVIQSNNGEVPNSRRAFAGHLNQKTGMWMLGGKLKLD